MTISRNGIWPIESNVYYIEYDVIYSASIKRPYGDHKMSGYTIEEKVEIARQHLLQDNLKNMA
jgi:hypothetical protein